MGRGSGKGEGKGAADGCTPLAFLVFVIALTGGTASTLLSKVSG